MKRRWAGILGRWGLGLALTMALLCLASEWRIGWNWQGRILGASERVHVGIALSTGNLAIVSRVATPPASPPTPPWWGEFELQGRGLGGCTRRSGFTTEPLLVSLALSPQGTPPLAILVFNLWVLGLGGLASWMVTLPFRRADPARAADCPVCTYDLSGLPPCSCCPECGAPQTPVPSAHALAA